MIFILCWIWIAEGRCRMFCLPSQISSVVTTFFSVMSLSSVCAKTFVYCAATGFREATYRAALCPSLWHTLEHWFIVFHHLPVSVSLRSTENCFEVLFHVKTILDVDNTPKYYGEINSRCIHISEMNHQSLPELQTHSRGWLPLLFCLLFPLDV